jgi:putative ABC transport system permease protein
MLLDVRYALRTLLKNPGFTVVAVVTLAVGIGANTAIFSVVNGVLLRPLPYPDPERIVNVWVASDQEPRGIHSASDFLEIARRNQSLTAIAGYRAAVFTVSSRGGAPVTLEGMYATVDFFDVLGVSPAAGRVFSRSRDLVPADRLVVLGDAAWQQLYDRARDAIGSRLRVDGESYTVVGVLEPRAGFPEDAQLWVLSDTPVPPSPIKLADPEAEREVRYFPAIARVRPHLSLQQARFDVERVAAVLGQRHSQTEAGRTLRLGPVYEEMVEDVRWGLIVLQSAVGLVLLIACANVASLLIARASARRRELAIRAALGAGRPRLVRQLLTESLVLSAVGGLAGLLLGAWLVGLIVGVLPDAVPRASEIRLDPMVALGALLTALVTGALFGVLPAMYAARTDAAAALKQGGDRGSSSRSRGRAALVVAEIAITLVLLAGAGLLLNSFVRLRHVDSGMQPANVTVLSLALPPSRYPTDEAQGALYARMLEAVSGRPGLQAVGVGFPGPLRGSNASGSFDIEGRPARGRGDRPGANIGAVSGGFFAAMGIPLLAGRTFAESDDTSHAGVAIASVALARKYWPGENVIGRRLRFDSGANAPWITIVGLVGDVRQLGLEASPPPILYIPYRQFTLPFTNLAVRSTAPPAAVASMLRAALTSVDPELPFGEITTLQGVLDRSVDQPRFRATLLGSFAVAAVILAAVGLYGLMSYSVSTRTRELGIRLALGAQPRQVLLSIMREGLALGVAGTALGLAAAFVSVRVISSFLFGVGAGDPLTFAAVALRCSSSPSRPAISRPGAPCASIRSPRCARSEVLE